MSALTTADVSRLTGIPIYTKFASCINSIHRCFNVLKSPLFIDGYRVNVNCDKSVNIACQRLAVGVFRAHFVHSLSL